MCVRWCLKNYALKQEGLMSPDLAFHCRREMAAGEGEYAHMGVGSFLGQQSGWGWPSWSGVDMECIRLFRSVAPHPACNVPHSRSRRQPAPGTGFPGPSLRRVHSPWAQMGSRGALGGREHTHAPRQQIKCSLPGRTWGLVLSCPPNPDAWSHLAKTLPAAVPGSWALTEGATWPRGPRAV